MSSASRRPYGYACNGDELPCVCRVLRQSGGEAKVLTAVDIQGVGERYSTDKAIEYLKSGKVVMSAAAPAAVFLDRHCRGAPRSRRSELTLSCLQRTSTVCTRQTRRSIPSAVKYDSISYDDVLAQHLAVMDSTATSLAMDNDIPVIVFALAEPENIVRVLQGEKLGTTVTK